MWSLLSKQTYACRSASRRWPAPNPANPLPRTTIGGWSVIDALAPFGRLVSTGGVVSRPTAAPPERAPSKDSVPPGAAAIRRSTRSVQMAPQTDCGASPFVHAGRAARSLEPPQDPDAVRDNSSRRRLLFVPVEGNVAKRRDDPGQTFAAGPWPVSGGSIRPATGPGPGMHGVRCRHEG